MFKKIDLSPSAAVRAKDHILADEFRSPNLMKDYDGKEFYLNEYIITETNLYFENIEKI